MKHSDEVSASEQNPCAIKHLPLAALLSEKLIKVARDYCVKVDEPFFRIGRFPRLKGVKVLREQERSESAFVKEKEIAPQVLNWWLQALRDERPVTLRVELDEDDATLRYVGHPAGTIDIKLFDPTNRSDEDKKFNKDWLRSGERFPCLAEMKPEEGPFKTRLEMAPQLRDHFDNMMQLLQSVGRGTPDEEAKRKAYELLWEASENQERIELGVEHPLVQFNLYCTFELIARFAGWDLGFFNSNWAGYWASNAPHWWPDRDNRRWAKIYQDPSLRNYIDRLEATDLLMRLFDSVISDRIYSNFTFSKHGGKGEELLGARTDGNTSLMAGRFFEHHSIASRRHIPLMRLAEKIMDAYNREPKANDGKLKEAISIAFVGDTTVNDIEKLWDLITNPKTWKLGQADLEECFKFTFYAQSEDWQKLFAENKNISFDNTVRTIYDVPFGDFRLAFLLDCDGIYENKACSGKEKFHGLNKRVHNAFYASGCDERYAEGMFPERAMFCRAWALLDSFAYADDDHKDTYCERIVSFDALRSIHRMLNGHQTEMYVYASNAPEGNSLAFYLDEGLRICRQETLGSNTITVLRISNAQKGAMLCRKDSPPELLITLWQLFKSFDSHFCEWIGDQKLPPFGGYHDDLTVRDVLFPNQKEEPAFSVWVHALKTTEICLDYSGVQGRSKRVIYYFKFDEDLLTQEREGVSNSAKRNFLRLECYLKKMVADFFAWLQGTQPNPTQELVEALRERCIHVFKNCILGSCKTVEDVFFYYIVSKDDPARQGLTFSYDERPEQRYEDDLFENGGSDSQSNAIPDNIVDRSCFHQLMRIMDASRFDESLLAQMPVNDLHEAAQAIHRVCAKLNYTESALYANSGRY